jgi:membrane-associated phospholipid phosphatase
MSRWEPWVRRQVVDFDLWSNLKVICDQGERCAKIKVHQAIPPKTTNPNQGTNQLVKLIRPNSRYLVTKQLSRVLDYADLRRDRAPEIVSQATHFVQFFAGVCDLRSDHSRYTLELIEVFRTAVVAVQMRTKHALATRRPVDFSAQVLPIIPTPGHSSFPAGHAVEAFMMATVLGELVADQDNDVYQGQHFWREMLLRLAARISVNRVIAGVHFPVDLAAGMVMGILLGRYFVRLAKARTGAGVTAPNQPLTGWKFIAKEYGDQDFVWRDIFDAIDTNQPTRYLQPRSNPFSVVPASRGRSPLHWLARLNCQRPLEELKRLGIGSAIEGPNAGIGPQYQIVGIEAFRPLAARSLDLCRAHRRLDCADHSFGDPVLQIENIGHRAVVPVRPKMVSRRSIDELSGDTDAIAGLAHASFDQIAHAKLAARLLGGDHLSFVGKGRISGDERRSRGRDRARR